MIGGFLRKMRKKLLTVQMEKTEINILQKEWGKKHFYFLRYRKKKSF